MKEFIEQYKISRPSSLVVKLFSTDCEGMFWIDRIWDEMIQLVIILIMTHSHVLSQPCKSFDIIHPNYTYLM